MRTHVTLGAFVRLRPSNVAVGHPRRTEPGDAASSYLRTHTHTHTHTRARARVRARRRDRGCGCPPNGEATGPRAGDRRWSSSVSCVTMTRLWDRVTVGFEGPTQAVVTVVGGKRPRSDDANDGSITVPSVVCLLLDVVGHDLSDVCLTPPAADRGWSRHIAPRAPTCGLVGMCHRPARPWRRAGFPRYLLLS